MKKEIIFTGIGGQGILKSAILLAHAANSSGFQVVQAASYDAAARGSVTEAEVLFSDSPIAFPHCENADIHLSMNEKAYLKYKALLKKDGLLIFDSSVFKPADEADGIYGIPATEMALKDLKKSFLSNIILLGALSFFMKDIKPEIFDASLKENFGKHYELNLKAFNNGREYFEKR